MSRRKIEVEREFIRLWRAVLTAVLAIAISCCMLTACGTNPIASNETSLPTGRWTGDGACLSVVDSGCDLAVGCGHGQFPRPMIRSDGTFDAEGTYRIEIGPVSIDPPPAAHFSGSLIDSRLILTVVPTVPGLPPVSYSMTPTTGGRCSIPCV